VSRRILWVGDAAYPLQNLSRIRAFVMLPRKQEAVVRFLKRLGLIIGGGIALFLALTPLMAFGGGEAVMTLLFLAGSTALALSIVDLVRVLSAPPYHVLLAETNGGGHALVTSHQPQQLHGLAHQITEAIEHPETEFQVRVDTITLNPKHYYFGDNVNMYGGNGNTGVSK
jgi:membrane protein implicated in regulation of membrane protease activity